MKTSRLPSYSVRLLAVLGAWMTVTVGAAHAGGPAFGAPVGGSSATFGGQAAVSSGAGAHVSVPVSSAGSAAGTHDGGNGRSSAAGLTSTGAGYNGTPHDLSARITPNVISAGLSLTRTNRPSAAHTVGRSLSTTPAVPARDSVGSVNSQTPVLARVSNAWTDPVVTGASNFQNGRAGRLNAATVGLRHENNFSGTILYPDAYRDVIGNQRGSINTSHGKRSGNVPRFHFHNRGYYNPYAYSYPYGLYGGYTPYVYNDIAGVGAPASDYEGEAENGSGGDSNALSADAVNNLARPNGSGGATFIPQPLESADNPASAPAPQTSANPTLKSNSGPDSLVEAVQAELARRGYFGGKVDAIYNEATHAAIQRFQSDQQLAATGRINDATLHALQLD